ncbi:MAG: zinc ribbon domain-containing protein [Candidatus Thiodiazotropha sp. (ex Monitilora ramsayi)]|nr:zinc ribbon domain-containing protein [Candidatus Thiodiazotropha sp. (ex Monitilora ramsayi)]
MPYYDYQCQACHDRFEARQAIAAVAPPCPRCGGPAVRMILSAPAVHGTMARGRELAAKSIPVCGRGCRCCP